MSLTHKSERMMVDAINHALANPGERVLVMKGDVQLVIESSKVNRPSAEEVIATENGSITFFDYEAETR